MIMRSKLALASCLVLTLAGRAASAGPAGVIYNADLIGRFALRVVTQNPGVTWTFQTSALSPASDTVIHVQNNHDLQGGYIAGNDDEAPGVLSSKVVVPPISTSRDLMIVVRAYAVGSGGTCTITGTPSSVLAPSSRRRRSSAGRPIPSRCLSAWVVMSRRPSGKGRGTTPSCSS